MLVQKGKSKKAKKAYFYIFLAILNGSFDFCAPCTSLIIHTAVAFRCYGWGWINWQCCICPPVNGGKAQERIGRILDLRF